MNRFEQWTMGLQNGLPICMGYFAVAFTFGMRADETGLTAFQAALLSFTNLTSAGQFAGLDQIAYGASYLEVAFAQLVINLRYCLMSCALSQKLDQEYPFWHRLFVAYGVTDEIFGITICRVGRLSPYYTYGVMCVAVPGWTLGTLAGILSGELMSQRFASALGIAIYAMFLAVILPAAKRDKVVLGAVLTSMGLSLAFEILPLLNAVSTGLRVILITLAVSAFCALLFPVREREGGEDGN